MRWIMLLPFSVKTTIKISILMIMLPHEAWVSAGLSEISKNIPVLHQCNSLWESASTMLRCYLKQQLIPSMRFLRLSDMITSFISAGFFTSWKDIRQENTESWETNSEIHKEDTTESSKQWFVVSSSLFYYSYFVGFSCTLPETLRPKVNKCLLAEAPLTSP